MNPPRTIEASTDADLVTAAREQEPGAYGELFRRWYDRCYDVALNILRDREAAADVAQDVFLVGWERLVDLRDPDAFGGWILRTARNRALNRLSRDRSRTVEPIEHQPSEPPGATDHDADPALMAEREDQRRLVWTAVAALGERDSSLLDLHLRHGLESAEIAEELAITPNHASQLLFRLRRKLREVIGSVLLWRDGRPTCDQLATLVAQAGPFTPQVAATIRRHRRGCERCLAELSRQTDPERLFAALPLALAPVLLRQRAAEALVQAGIPMFAPAAAGGAAAAPAAAAGAPQGVPGSWPGPRMAAVGGAVALAVAAAVALWPSGPGETHAAPRHPATTGVASPPAAGPTPAPTSSPAASAPTPATAGGGATDPPDGDGMGIGGIAPGPGADVPVVPVGSTRDLGTTRSAPAGPAPSVTAVPGPTGAQPSRSTPSAPGSSPVPGAPTCRLPHHGGFPFWWWWCHFPPHWPAPC